LGAVLSARRCAVACGAVLAASAAVTVLGDDTAWTLPRTSDGQPLLQGYWTNTTVVPFERPGNVADRTNLTEEEARQRLRQSLTVNETEAGTAADVHYQLTDFGLDNSQNTVVLDTRTSLVVDPPNGRIPAALPAAVARGAERAAYQREHSFDSAQNRSLAERCIMWGHELPITPTIYNSNLQILQAPGYVAIVTEMMPDARIVPLDGRAPAPNAVRGYFGDSVGRWEGDELVVETTNLNGKTSMRGVPRGATLSTDTRIVERFERVGESTIRYQFTVHDPSTWERPWSAEIPMTKIDGPLFEYACHEGNYGLANILSGARADERAQ
jgi:hypothetical protein